jgi:hypothetical protein
MRVAQIGISNFRGIHEATVGPLPPVAGIWGPNGSGKSTVLQAVVSFKQLAYDRNAYGGMPPPLNQGGLSLGTWENIFWQGGGAKQPLQITLNPEKGNPATLIVRGPGNSPQVGQPIPDVSGIRYFPANRALLSRTSDVQSSPTANLGIQPAQVHPFVHWFYHQKVRERQRTGKPNEVDRIDGWMTKVGFGPLSDRLASPGQVYALFEDPVTGYSTPFLDGGFGGIVFAPLLLESYSFINGMILIEEPEISLHPAAQAELFDFFVEMARERGHQILFTSHSTYLLGRIARFLRDEDPKGEFAGVISASKSADGSHFARVASAELISRLEKKQPLLPELHIRDSQE